MTIPDDLPPRRPVLDEDALRMVAAIRPMKRTTLTIPVVVTIDQPAEQPSPTIAIFEDLRALVASARYGQLGIDRPLSRWATSVSATSFSSEEVAL